MSSQDIGRDAIERLRQKAPERATPLTIQQALDLVEMIKAVGTGIEKIAAKIGMSPEETVMVVVDLGTWLGQTLNNSIDAKKVVEYDKAPHPTDDVDGILQMQLFKQHTDDIIVLPPGFERRATKRDLRKAVGQIVKGSPDESLLRRWLLRRYHRIYQVLSFDVVAMVHRICQIGRLGEIDQVADREVFHAETGRVLVEAYDFLDVARSDAVAAVERLCEMTERSLDEISKDLAEAAWLHQASFNRFEVNIARQPGRVHDVLAMVRRLVHQDPYTYMPPSVAQLNDGQVRTLALREGLRVDPTEFREAETVRTWVADAGLEVDADLLVADGIRAARAGLGELFCSSLERRAQGDLEWADQLNEALAGVAAI